MDLTAERSLGDIAGAHEVIVDVAPAAAVPAAAALTRDRISKVGGAVINTKAFSTRRQ